MGLLEMLKSTFRYDPDTGKIYQFASSRSRWAHREVGWSKSGYLSITAPNGSKIPAHRVAWMLKTDAPIPDGMLIDHINGDRSDNRWANLRLATRSQNNHNRHQVRSDSKTGIRGVKYRAERDRYVPVLKIDGKERKFGSFRTIEAAAARFVEVERQHRGEHASCLF